MIEIPKESLQKVFDGETLELEVPGGREGFVDSARMGKSGKLIKIIYEMAGIMIKSKLDCKSEPEPQEIILRWMTGDTQRN